MPPHDEQAEKAVLGAILIDSAAMNLVAEFLRPKHFYSSPNALIFEAMLSLFDRQEPIDIVTVKNELKKGGNLKKIGGKAYLAELIENVPTSAYVEHYGKIVKSNYTKRKIIDVASRLVEEAFEEEEDVDRILDSAEGEIFALSQEHLKKDFVELKDALAESFERLEKFMREGRKLRGLSTGLSSLDVKLAGMQDSNLLVLAARPGLGKTTLALNIALNVVLKEKVPVGFFSLEMSKEELVDRLLVGQADIDSWRLKTGRLSDDDYRRLTESMGVLTDAPLFIDDTPGSTILEMRSKARKLKAEKGLRFLIVDYLQLASAGRRFESRVQEVSFISQGLKNLARELKIPVLALSQLSRAVEQRGSKKPQLADLRESGAIEQDADIVMFLYRESDDNEDLLNEDKKLIKLFIAKHRNGPTGEIDLMFYGSRLRFYPVETKETES